MIASAVPSLHVATLTAVSFGLLALAICSVWLDPIEVSRNRHIALWPLLFGAAVISGLIAGNLGFPAIIGLGTMMLAAILAIRQNAHRAQQWLFTALAAVIGVALAVHTLPGFDNPVLIANVTLSPDAEPFTQYANFDKGAAGLVILAFFCRRAKTAAQWRDTLRRACPVAVLTAATVLGIALVTGHLRVDPKLPAYAPVFLAVNLMFTCVAEEAFFRGLLQDRLGRALHAGRVPCGDLIAVAGPALLFGLAHGAGGPWYMIMSGLAGVGYGYAYAVTQRVEAPILVHFVVNAVHFLGFTYPRLA